MDSHSFDTYFRASEINHFLLNRKAENILLLHEFCEKAFVLIEKED